MNGRRLLQSSNLSRHPSTAAAAAVTATPRPAGSGCRTPSCSVSSSTALSSKGSSTRNCWVLSLLDAIHACPSGDTDHRASPSFSGMQKPLPSTSSGEAGTTLGFSVTSPPPPPALPPPPTDGSSSSVVQAGAPNSPSVTVNRAGIRSFIACPGQLHPSCQRPWAGLPNTVLESYWPHAVRMAARRRS